MWNEDLQLIFLRNDLKVMSVYVRFSDITLLRSRNIWELSEDPVQDEV